MADMVRTDRISIEMQRELSDVISTMKDPRITGMVSVTRVDVTRDLRHAKVYISVYNEDEKAAKTAFDAIEAASGFLRREVGSRLLIRYTPQLHFVFDHSIEYGVEMTHRIDEVMKNERAREV